MNPWLKALLAGTGLYLGVHAGLRRRRWIDLDGRSVLITGGSRGLGLLLARRCVALGADVAICARDADELARVRDEFARRGQHIETFVCDVTDPDAVWRMVDDVLKRMRTVDVLINNAAQITVGPVESMTRTDFEEAMRLNFWAPLNLVDVLLPHLRKRPGARIVNIASIGGKLPAPHLLPYTASKHALVGFSNGLRIELAKAGVLVTTVCPGLMRTGSPRNADFKGRHREEFAWFNLADSLPVVSQDAERAARQIVSAMQGGEAELFLGLPAKIAIRLANLFPNGFAELSTLADRLFPKLEGEGSVGTRSMKGSQSESEASRTRLAALGDKAAAANNQL